MNTKRSIFPSLITLITLSIIPLTSQAVSVIDFFDDADYQEVFDFGNTPGATASVHTLTVAPSELTGIRRTLSAEAGGVARRDRMAIRTAGGLISVANSTRSAGTASILWDNFGTVDFTQGGNNAFKLEVLALDDKTITAEMIVNGTSNSVNNALSSVGDYFYDFASFSDASLLNQVTSLEMRLSGPLAWDGQFRLSAVAAPVPLPPSFFLMSLALAGFAAARRKMLDASS